MKKTYDCIVLGAGIYGLYTARLLAKKHRRIAVLEYDAQAFQRASYVNQARVHNGYHYPRSYSTAKKSIDYFKRFNDEFSFAVNSSFKKIYAIASKYSFTSGSQFQKFCDHAGVPCIEINKRQYFKENLVDAAFETQEYAFCAIKIRDYFLNELTGNGRVDVQYGKKIKQVDQDHDHYILSLNSGERFSAPHVINATYASVNQVLSKFGFDLFHIKYEICEVILCDTCDLIRNTGITVMDGPFFSVMPFGFDTHSLTAVAFTPHVTSYDLLPSFNCQKINPSCTLQQLENCDLCHARPKTSWRYMSQLSKKYLNDDIKISYKKSLFAVKPILMASELDDSRPTIIKTFSINPKFTSVFSGKINTIYDLDEVLQ